MQIRFAFVGLALILGLSASARSRAVRHPEVIPSPMSVLWIGAHPDDEVVAAPLIAKWCRDDGARCAFLTLTRGEAGACLRDGGCLPDVASVRSAEAAASSQYFGATSILLTLPDGGGSIPPAWSALGSDEPDLATTLSRYIQAFQPAAIFTFDPRHGTTCHPDHRATADLVLEAVKRLPNAPVVYFLETTVTFGESGLRFRSATPFADRFDANEVLRSTGESAWQAAIEDMQLHRSQFNEAWIVAMQAVRESERAVFIARAETILLQPVETCR